MRVKWEQWMGIGVIVLLLAVFSWVLYRTAWLCDDAYITFRTVDHFINGHGMRWNIAERVQSFTHPLWFFLLSAGFLLSGACYYTALGISVALTLITLAGIGWVARREPFKGISLLAVLLFSQAFVDYSTSGLENPLSHTLLFVFLVLCGRTERGYGWLLATSMVAAFALLTRLDLGLLVFPCLVHAWSRFRDRRALAIVALGLIPLFAWLAFSLFYYGFLFPNTAYAKLGTGIPAGELWMQGLRYLQNSLTRDPLTLIVIVTALCFPFIFRQRNRIPAALGIVLYLVYIVRIGGDFMSGRFLTPPLFFSVLLLIRMPVRIGPKTGIGLTIAAVLIGMATPHSPLLSGPQYGQGHDDILDAFMIADERAFYYRKTGSAAPGYSKPGSARPSEPKRELSGGANAFQVVERDTTGMSGYLAGPEVHVIDVYALSDPLLARLPMIYAPKWRTGHFRRHVPDGYKETLASGENRLEDPNLAAYYDQLALVTRGPLFSTERFMTVLRFQWGAYDPLIDKERYRFPNLRRIVLPTQEKGSAPPRLETPVAFEKGGLALSWQDSRYDGELELEVEGGPYYLLFMQDTEIVGLLPNMPPSPLDVTGIEPGNTCLQAPPSARNAGFNALRIMPFDSRTTYRLNTFNLGK